MRAINVSAASSFSRSWARDAAGGPAATLQHAAAAVRAPRDLQQGALRFGTNGSEPAVRRDHRLCRMLICRDDAAAVSSPPPFIISEWKCACAVLFSDAELMKILQTVRRRRSEKRRTAAEPPQPQPPSNQITGPDLRWIYSAGVGVGGAAFVPSRARQRHDVTAAPPRVLGGFVRKKKKKKKRATRRRRIRVGPSAPADRTRRKVA